MEPGQKEKMLECARVRLHFCLELYGIQKAAGRYFLHECPATAISWKDPKGLSFMQQHVVDTTIMHACQD
eukprot:16435250-Heterocapsa_arctica.AAC.1